MTPEKISFLVRSRTGREGISLISFAVSEYRWSSIELKTFVSSEYKLQLLRVGLLTSRKRKDRNLQ